MMARLFDAFFGCWHSRYSFPITIRQKNLGGNTAASVTGTYVVCLDCGKELPYDWTEMKVAAAVSSAPGSGVEALASEHAA